MSLAHVRLLALSLTLVACNDKGSESKAEPGSSLVDPGSKDNPRTSSSSATTSAGPPAVLQASAKDVSPADRKYVVDPAVAKVRFEDVKLAEDTVVVASSALGQSAGSVGTHTFDTAALGEAAAQLEKGKVLLVPGRLLGKVTSVHQSGDKTIVKTEFAALTDALTDAKIGWNAELPIGRANLVAMVLPDGRELPVQKPVMYAALPGHSLPKAPPEPMEWSLTEGQLTYSAKLDQGQDYLDLVLQVSRKMANSGGMAYTGKIRMKPVTVTGDGTIEGGKTRRFDVQQKEVGGDITLSMAVAGAGRNEINKDLPMPVFKWIVLMGPVPVSITAKPRVIGRVDLPAKGSSVGTAKFSFGGEASFKFDGATIEATAAFPEEKFDVDKPFDAAGFIGGAVDAQFGMAFPVVGMAMFDSFFMPELIPGAQIGARLTWGPVCKTAYMLYTVKAAYDFQVLGVSLRQGKTTLYENKKYSKGQECRNPKETEAVKE